MNPPGEEGGWYYSIRLSQIQEQFGGGERNLGCRGRDFCKSTTHANYLQFDKSACAATV
jgi:hypothetical protein